MIKICLLGKDTICYNDVDFSSIEALGEVTYALPKTEDETVEACKGATAVLVNKTEMTERVISRLPDLKYIGAFATGYNNIDLNACKKYGVRFCNAPDYSMEAVAQHTIALLLAQAGSLPQYIRSVADGDWLKAPNFSYYTYPMYEVYGKTLGIFGFGRIGKRVAEIASVLGMNVLVHGHHPLENSPYEQVSTEELFKRSDYLSLHCPLTEETRGLVNEQTLAWMKPSAVLINTARGPLIDEKALVSALETGRLRGACLDVIEKEPMREDCPLIGVKNVLITPHVAWNAADTRQRLVEQTAQTLKAFLDGNPVNVIV